MFIKVYVSIPKYPHSQRGIQIKIERVVNLNKQARPTTFGKIVKVKLIELNMTQVELAKMLGIKRQYLCRILSGDRSGKKYLPDIRKILGIDNAA